MFLYSSNFLWIFTIFSLMFLISFNSFQRSTGKFNLGGSFGSQASDSFRVSSSYRSRWACSVPCPAEFSVSSRVKIPYPIWAAHSSIWPASWWRVISLYLYRIFLAAIFFLPLSLLLCISEKKFVSVFSVSTHYFVKKTQIDLPLAHASSGWINPVLPALPICHMLQPPLPKL